MDNYKKILIFLSKFELSNKKLETIMQIVEDKNIKNIEELSNDGDIMDSLSSIEYHEILKNCDERLLASMITNLEKSNVKVLTKNDEEYPESLIDLPDVPMILFAKGNLDLLKAKAISIVGTRMPTNYGRFVTEKFAETLAKAGVVIVSGLAYGVDAISHKKALEVGGKTIAVLGGGFNHIYPEAHTNLANEIAEKGLILSEYAPFIKPTKFSFPRRNRIIAGLSLGTLITEASKKSGTIHTKEYALTYGKDVFAVPGNINSPKSELTNMLIKSAQAECVLSGNDILEYYGISTQNEKKKMISLNFEEQTIINLLQNGEQDFDYLAKNSNISVNNLNSYLTTLEIRGLIKRMPAKTYMLN